MTPPPGTIEALIFIVWIAVILLTIIGVDAAKRALESRRPSRKKAHYHEH